MHQSHQIATAYYDRNIRVMPVKPQSKEPLLHSWSTLQLTKEDIPRVFQDPTNYGIQLGMDTECIVDIDLDSPEARQLAPLVLPATAVFGRASSRRSHYLYRLKGSSGLPSRVAYTDPVGGGEHSAMLLEFRWSGCYTLAPHSIHPSGEPVTWDDDREIYEISTQELLAFLNHLAAAALLLRYWQKKNRRDPTRSLIGFVMRYGVSPEQAARLATLVNRGDGEKKHLIWSRNAEQHLQTDRSVYGPQTMAKHFPSPVFVRALRWLLSESGSVLP